VLVVMTDETFRTLLGYTRRNHAAQG